MADAKRPPCPKCGAGMDAWGCVKCGNTKQELPGERSARIVRELREQDADDAAQAEAALDRFISNPLTGFTDYPEAEKGAFKVGYKECLRDIRRAQSFNQKP